MATQETKQTRRGAAFDIRMIIALLMGVYGVVLTVLGLWFTTDEEIHRSVDVNINLWAGICMVVAALLFVAWALIRPLRIPHEEKPAE